MKIKRIIHEIQFIFRDKSTVIIESPFFVKGNRKETRVNIRYAQKCMKDSLKRGEKCFLSHLLYTQVLDDNIPEERTLGIDAGLALGDQLYKTVVYTDRGISPGMEKGIARAIAIGRPVEYRSLYK